MENEKRYHSVRLDKSRCRGCTNCLKRCPTEAIRVHSGRAHIMDERCIDCGECIRICTYHAKLAVTDGLEALKEFRYTVALPAPSLYGQFRHVKSADHVLSALKMAGFDDVFEVARGADLVSRALHDKLREPGLPKPLISSACPAVVRLIQVRFPDLLPHVVNIRQPMEVAADMARREVCQRESCAPEEVGVFMITPCPAKMTAIRSPLGQRTSSVSGAISMLDLYGLLRSFVHKGQQLSGCRARATSYGLAWAASNGEASAVCPENSLAVDGIHNCLQVLEEIENNKLNDLVFFEGSACVGGCVGGPLTVENNYVAKNTIRRLTDESRARQDDHPAHSVPVSLMGRYALFNDAPFLPNDALRLDDDIEEAMRKMEQMNRLVERLPGYDCGSCGAPTCRCFAEDIVRGYRKELECVHLLRGRLKEMAQDMVELARDGLNEPKEAQK
ncbi:MAG: 4Fe-4S dicluster domain-containing protein [Clostridiales bacterium]|nr:4Fe-4S dicluster domain-containing protein [Clostridiales bacterium]